MHTSINISIYLVSFHIYYLAFWPSKEISMLKIQKTKAERLIFNSVNLGPPAIRRRNYMKVKEVLLISTMDIIRSY